MVVRFGVIRPAGLRVVRICVYPHCGAVGECEAGAARADDLLYRHGCQESRGRRIFLEERVRNPRQGVEGV